MLTFRSVSTSPSSAKPTAVPLSSLPIGTTVTIDNITSPKLEMILLKLGIAKGDRVHIANKAPFGDPIALNVNGMKISLRKKDAACIRVFNR